MPKRTAAILTLLRRRLAVAGGLRAEGGFMLMEAVASAALLAVVVVGVLAAMDGASASSGRQKARSAAAQLAEQDQERLRSMRVVDLSTYGKKTRTATLAGASYTITSQARWVTDVSGAETCTAGPQGDYLRITSTVTSTPVAGATQVVGQATRPVTIESIVAPPVATFGPGQGTLAVMVTDRDDQPLSNLAVAISGPGSYSDLTNSVGCALFGYVPAGTYDITLTQSGYVDHSGDNVSTGKVNEGVVNVQPVQFDRAATIDAGFIARFKDQAGVLGDHDVQAASVSVANAKVPGRMLAFPSAGGQQQASLQATSLFPFGDGYTVFTGQCVDADPTRFASNYFTTPGNPGFVNVSPGATATTKVRQGALDLTVRKRVGTVWSAAGAGLQVKVTPTGTDCGPAMTDWTTAADGRVTKTPAAGFPFDPSLPYGDYDVCAYDPSANLHGDVSVDVASVDPSPSPAGEIQLKSSGACP